MENETVWSHEMFRNSSDRPQGSVIIGQLAEGLQMAISRRQFCEGLMVGGRFVGTPALGGPHARSWPQSAATRTGSDLGSLYPFVQAQAERSRFELSLLHPEFTNLRQWQGTVRARIFEHLYYAPSRVPPQPQVIRRTDKGDYVEQLPELSNDSRPARARVRAGTKEGSIARAGRRGAAQP
jgi:hypothetical protein